MGSVQFETKIDIQNNFFMYLHNRFENQTLHVEHVRDVPKLKKQSSNSQIFQREKD